MKKRILSVFLTIAMLFSLVACGSSSSEEPAAKEPEKEIKEALKELDQYETMHVSCLVEVGIKLIEKHADEQAAKEYFDAHAEYFDEGKVERLRRITGYLVGTLDRWNDAKKAEEKARVKHSVNSSVDDAERLVALETQAMSQNVAYAR